MAIIDDLPVKILTSTSDLVALLT